jgi:hypothetical protein
MALTEQEMVRLQLEAKQLKGNKLLWDTLDTLEREVFDLFKSEKEVNNLTNLHAKVQALDTLRDELDGRINEYTD